MPSLLMQGPAMRTRAEPSRRGHLRTNGSERSMLSMVLLECAADVTALQRGHAAVTRHCINQN